uniref:Putative secreted protein n=1 Tax=Anopheles marajoara TaxID=58244 RepID=A0A2M4C5X0_9DIPT
MLILFNCVRCCIALPTCCCCCCLSSRRLVWVAIDEPPSCCCRWMPPPSNFITFSSPLSPPGHSFFFHRSSLDSPPRILVLADWLTGWLARYGAPTTTTMKRSSFRVREMWRFLTGNRGILLRCAHQHQHSVSSARMDRIRWWRSNGEDCCSRRRHVGSITRTVVAAHQRTQRDFWG